MNRLTINFIAALAFVGIAAGLGVAGAFALANQVPAGEFD